MKAPSPALAAPREHDPSVIVNDRPSGAALIAAAAGLEAPFLVM